MDLLFVVLIFLLVGALFAGIGVWKLSQMAWPENNEPQGTAGTNVEEGTKE